MTGRGGAVRMKLLGWGRTGCPDIKVRSGNVRARSGYVQVISGYVQVRSGDIQVRSDAGLLDRLAHLLDDPQGRVVDDQQARGDTPHFTPHTSHPSHPHLLDDPQGRVVDDQQPRGEPVTRHDAERLRVEPDDATHKHGRRGAGLVVLACNFMQVTDCGA